jgi:hypothetical protein
MLSEIRQTKKKKYCMFSLFCEIETKKELYEYKMGSVGEGASRRREEKRIG